MGNLPEELNNKIDHLEETISVSYNVFKYYQPLFCTIFKQPEPIDPEQTRHRNRKQR